MRENRAIVPKRDTPDETIRSAILEIKQITGLRREQIGRIVSVTSRTVHHWAEGKPANARNERRVHHLLKIARNLDNGIQEIVRNRLLNHIGAEKDRLRKSGFARKDLLDHVAIPPKVRRAPGVDLLRIKDTTLGQPPPWQLLLGGTGDKFENETVGEVEIIEPLGVSSKKKK